MIRGINDDAVEHMSTRFVVNPVDPSSWIRLRETETVKASEQVLREATDLTCYTWWVDELDQFFDIAVMNPDVSAYANADTSLTEPLNAARMKTLIADDMRAFLKDLYSDSETFRGLANQAEATGKIKKGRAWIIENDWTIDIVLPDSLKNGEAIFNREMQVLFNESPLLNIDTFPTFRFFSDKNRIVVPDVGSPSYTVSGRPPAVYEGGKRAATSSRLAIVHEMIHVLTGRRDPVKPSIERGAVEYLSQRVLREIGIKEPRQLTYIIPDTDFADDVHQNIEHHINTQDDYLSKLFPESPRPLRIWP